jgi:hypothetical protein
MGVLYTHFLKSPGLFPKLPKILFFKFKKIKKNWNSLTGTSVDPTVGGRRPTISGLGSASNQRSPAGHGSTPTPIGLFPFFLNFFFFLPSTFCASGQLLLVGSSTCPPCPNFSLKLQTSITFDP